MAKQLPNLVLHRNHTLATTSGHMVMFQKGVPTYVPPMVYKEAIAIGAIPETEIDLDRVFEQKNARNSPVDPIERAEKVLESVRIIKENGSRDDFTAGGKPKVQAVSTLLGWSVDQREITAALETIQEQDAEAVLNPTEDDEVIAEAAAE